MKMEDRLREIISRYVPENAITYCVGIWKKHPFSFKVTRERKSKVGDYRFNKSTGNHEITVNGNLNPYAFLITYLHEVAHLYHYKAYGNNRPPHGKVWKHIFRDLTDPVLKESIFPPDVLHQLMRHMKNPKASSQSDALLLRLLRKYDQEQEQGQSDTYLEDLTEGESFNLNGRAFKKIKKRRTRSLCTDLTTGKNYLISEMAKVEKPA
jgi:hypothetical protein